MGEMIEFSGLFFNFAGTCALWKRKVYRGTYYKQMQSSKECTKCYRIA